MKGNGKHYYEHTDGTTSVTDDIKDGYQLCDSCVTEYGCAERKQCGMLAIKHIEEDSGMQYFIRYNKDSKRELKGFIPSKGDEITFKEDWGDGVKSRVVGIVRMKFFIESNVCICYCDSYV